MKEIIFGIKMKTKKNKKIILFFVGLALIGFLAGSILVTLLSNSDKTLVKEYMEEYMYLVKNNKINYMSSFINASLSSTITCFIIWILGMSIIGLPFILFTYFIKSFTLGFSISSIIFNYKLKGCLLSFINIFPHQILNFLVYIILTTYSIFLSLRIINSIIKKKTIDFKIIMNK